MATLYCVTLHGFGGKVVPVTETTIEAHEALETTQQRQWVTIVWDDPVNLMSYVAHVFQEYFGFTKEKAERLMLQVHHEGRAAVSTGNREEMERDVMAMQNYSLWATMEPA